MAHIRLTKGLPDTKWETAALRQSQNPALAAVQPLHTVDEAG